MLSPPENSPPSTPSQDSNLASAAKTIVAQTDRPLPKSLCCGPKRRPPARRWFHWHEPGTTKEEKWLLFKLDFFILTYTCLVSDEKPRHFAASMPGAQRADCADQR